MANCPMILSIFSLSWGGGGITAHAMRRICPCRCATRFPSEPSSFPMDLFLLHPLMIFDQAIIFPPRCQDCEPIREAPRKLHVEFSF